VVERSVAGSPPPNDRRTMQALLATAENARRDVESLQQQLENASAEPPVAVQLV